MKNQFFILPLFLISLFLSPSCRKDFTNSSNNITIQLKTNTDNVINNAMAIGETWADSEEYDMITELEERYGIDINKNELISFKVERIMAEWESSRCQELSHISTEFILPDVDDPSIDWDAMEWDNRCTEHSSADFFSVPLLGFTLTNDPYGVTGVEFSDAINRGEKMTVKYSLTAAEAIDAGAMELKFSIQALAVFKPK